jgi:ribosomal protein S18 acetylase RimI-like enzyme
VIREAAPEDFNSVFELILELREELGEEKPVEREKMLAIFHRLLSSNEDYVYVAESEGRLVGLMKLSINESLYEDRPYVVINELDVADGHRGEGIGTRLVDEAFKLAERMDCCEVAVSTDSDNPGALRFYRRYGFDHESILFERDL